MKYGKGIINYAAIGKAIDYYTKRGFQYLEVPWIVSNNAVNATKPPDARSFETFMGQLVASGEQSFIEIRQNLCPGRGYQCVTPCFRDEKVLDDLHQNWFIKNELIIPLWKDDDEKQILKSMVTVAQSLFSCYYRAEQVETELGIDLFIQGCEVGSYGIREFEDFRWVYGTGWAEPRISQAIALAEIQREKSFADLLDD